MVAWQEEDAGMATDDTQTRIFGPARCDEAGGTECPYVIRGRLEKDEAGGGRIRVLEPPDCAAQWPTLDLLWMMPYDNLPHGEPRRLTPEEVRSLVTLLAVSGPRQ
jgi:hypothetical protein